MPRKQQYSIGELSQLCNVSKKALRFYGTTGRWVFRKLVRHPGSNIPARPFLGVGEDQKDEMRKLIVRQLERVVRGK